MKIEIEQIEATLLERKIDQPTVSAIIKDLMQSAEEEKAESEAEKEASGPKLKWEHLVILNDPENKLGTELTAWVIVQKEGQDAGLALSKLRDAVKESNESQKKKKNILENFGELFMDLKPKFLKEKGIKIKTKEAVRVLTVNGKML